MKILKRYYIIITLFVIGVIFGIFFLFFINDVDKLIVNNEIKEYFNIIKDKKNINYLNYFFNSYIENVLYYFIIWCSGFLFILIPVSYLIVFYKGFTIGFLFSNLVCIYKLKGIIYSIFFIFPHEILFIIFMFILVYLITKFAKKFLFILYNDDEYNIKKIIKKYFLLLIILLIVSIIISFSEIFINYFIMRLL